MLAYTSMRFNSGYIWSLCNGSLSSDLLGAKLDRNCLIVALHVARAELANAGALDVSAVTAVSTTAIIIGMAGHGERSSNF